MTNPGPKSAPAGEASASDEQMLRDTSGVRLWCMHIAGPDDVHAAPDFWTALAWAAELNAFMAQKAAAERWAEDDNYPLTQASVQPWPWSAERHATALAQELAERAEHEKRRAVLAAAPHAASGQPMPSWRTVSRSDRAAR